MRKLNIISVVLSAILIQSCITDKYDFGKDMELSVHFSDKGVSLGGTNSADIPLHQIIELSDSGQLTTDTYGNYLFYKSGDDMKPTETIIGQGSLGNAVDATLTYYIKTGGNTQISTGRYVGNMSFSHSWDIQYKNDRQESSVRDFVYISTPMQIEIYTYFNEVADFTDNVTLTYEIPSYYDIADESQLTETLNSADLKNEHYHVINITGIDFKKKSLRDGEKIGYNSSTGEMIMKGQITVTGSAKVFMSNYNNTQAPYMRSHIIVGTLGTTAITGRFDKSEKVDIEPITFENLPKFIQDNEVQLDVENPVVRMTLDNEIPANVTMDASLRSYKDGVRVAQLNVGKQYGTDDIEFDGATVTESPKRTNVWISRIPTEIPDSVSKDVVVNNMMDIITTIPDKIEVIATAHTDSTQIVQLSLGKAYYSTPKYQLVAPLKMGPNMKIIYTTDIDSLQDDLKNTNIGELYFNADVTNNIPLDLSIDVIPINENGDTLSNIQIITPESVPGLTTKNITFRLINTSDNQMQYVNRIQIKAYALSNENMAGKYLNKDQNIRLDNIKLQVKDTSINF